VAKPLRLLEGGLWVLAVAAAGYVGYVTLDRLFYDAREERPDWASSLRRRQSPQFV
jgi:hypothetical protein